MKTASHNPLSILRSPVAKPPQPPRHLSAASKRWFRSVVREWQLSDTDVKVLTAAAEALDRAEAARRTLAAEGSYYRDDRGIIHSHPAVGVESAAKKLAAKLINDLRLDFPPPRSAGRPSGPGISPRR